MRRTITLLATTLVAAAAITSTASAAALYTNSAHTALAPVGSTLIGATGGGQLFLRGGSVVVVCSATAAQLKVTQNSGGVVKLGIVARGFGGCSAPGWTPDQSGTVQISGSSITVGSTKAWLTTTLTGGGVAGMPENLVSATGNPPVNGVFAQQPTSGASPVSIVMNNAGTLTGATGPWQETGGFTLSGSYSLG